MRLSSGSPNKKNNTMRKFKKYLVLMALSLIFDFSAYAGSDNEKSYAASHGERTRGLCRN
jgi:hypothetical protein